MSLGALGANFRYLLAGKGLHAGDGVTHAGEGTFFFYTRFLSRTFTIHRTAGKGKSYLFNSSLPLPRASQIPMYYLGSYCRELTSSHSWQSDLNQEPLVSGCNLLTIKLQTIGRGQHFQCHHIPWLILKYKKIIKINSDLLVFYREITYLKAKYLFNNTMPQFKN